MSHVIEYDAECESCDGDGIRKIGVRLFAVCSECKGRGGKKTRIEYDAFKGKLVHTAMGDCRVVEEGIGIRNVSRDVEGVGMSYDEWERGDPFVIGMEMREHACPAWWYTSAASQEKPLWSECDWGGLFMDCGQFPRKDECWARFDREAVSE